jgi:putative membrane protein
VGRGALGAGYLASAHMVQFLLIALISPPLLLSALPPNAYEALAARPAVLRLLNVLTSPLIALAVFNVVLVATHWPSVVDSMMSTQWGSFTLDMAWWTGGLLLWWPIVAPVPERPRFTYMYKIGYLILATILNTPAFALLTFSDLPLYATFELAPPVSGLTTRVDQRIAGLLMKIGGGLIFWTAITILFARWYMSEQASEDVSG